MLSLLFPAVLEAMACQIRFLLSVCLVQLFEGMGRYYARVVGHFLGCSCLYYSSLHGPCSLDGLQGEEHGPL